MVERLTDWLAHGLKLQVSRTSDRKQPLVVRLMRPPHFALHDAVAWVNVYQDPRAIFVVEQGGDPFHSSVGLYAVGQPNHRIITLADLYEAP